jgi:hypothetical protein
MTTMDLLTSADVNELLDFLSEYAEYDSKFDTAKNYGENYEARFLKIALRFITPENSVKFETELSKTEVSI